MKLKHLVAIALLTILAFAVGAFWAEKKAWPFEWLANQPLLAAYVNQFLRPGPVIDSLVSPLKLTTTRAIQSSPDKHVGGGIHVYAGEVIIVTGHGEFLVYQDRNGEKSISKLDIALDNGFTEFQSYIDRNHLRIKNASQDFRFMDLVIVHDNLARAMLVTHHQWNSIEQCFTLRLSRLDLDLHAPIEGLSARTDDWQEVFDTRPCLGMKTRDLAFAGSISGGRIVVEGPESVLLSIGDHDFDGWNSEHILAQDSSSDFGKIVRVNLRTGIATHVSIGHRNPQGLMLDKNGTLWETEHGPRGGDELNIIHEGANYGWPMVTYGTRYKGWDWPLSAIQNRHNEYESPVFAWTPSIAVSNLIEVKGFLPEWEGDLLVSSLGNKSLHRLRYRDSRIVFDETIRIGYRIRDLDLLVDGAVIMWTDDAHVIELRPIRAIEQNTDSLSRLAEIR